MSASITAARARAAEASALLMALKRAPERIRVASHGSSVESADGSTLAWCGIETLVDAKDAEVMARMIAAAPKLLEQLAADVVALAEALEKR